MSSFQNNSSASHQLLQIPNISNTQTRLNQPLTTPIKLSFGKQIIYISALIDSGATGNFINQSLIIEKGIPFKKKSIPIEITLADNQPLNTSPIDFETKKISINVLDHVSIPWLKSCNPRIDWICSTIKIDKKSDITNISNDINFIGIPNQFNDTLASMLSNDDTDAEASYKSSTTNPKKIVPHLWETYLVDRPLESAKSSQDLEKSLAERHVVRDEISNVEDKNSRKPFESDLISDIKFLQVISNTLTSHQILHDVSDENFETLAT
ncbi:Retrotransposon-derived protein PEG10, partial [Zancudomyces culisetae]